MDTEYADVHVTCADDAEADRIADALVNERLAACVQAAPVRSVYVWEGRVEQDAEVLLTIKTRTDRFDPIVARVEELHSYELPAITMSPSAPSARTAAWIDDLVG